MTDSAKAYREVGGPGDGIVEKFDLVSLAEQLFRENIAESPREEQQQAQEEEGEVALALAEAALLARGAVRIVDEPVPRDCIDLAAALAVPRLLPSRSHCRPWTSAEMADEFCGAAVDTRPMPPQPAKPPRSSLAWCSGCHAHACRRVTRASRRNRPWDSLPVGTLICTQCIRATASD